MTVSINVCARDSAVVETDQCYVSKIRKSQMIPSSVLTVKCSEQPANDAYVTALPFDSPSLFMHYTSSLHHEFVVHQCMCVCINPSSHGSVRGRRS